TPRRRCRCWLREIDALTTATSISGKPLVVIEQGNFLASIPAYYVYAFAVATTDRTPESFTANSARPESFLRLYQATPAASAGDGSDALAQLFNVNPLNHKTQS